MIIDGKINHPGPKLVCIIYIVIKFRFKKLVDFLYIIAFHSLLINEYLLKYIENLNTPPFTRRFISSSSSFERMQDKGLVKYLLC